MAATVAQDHWLVLDAAAADPFGRLDEFLARHGFGVWSEPFVPAADGLVADLFLGYALAASLPGVTAPMPPEPCPLPALACRVRSAEGDRQGVAGTLPGGRIPADLERARAPGGGVGGA